MSLRKTIFGRVKAASTFNTYIGGIVSQVSTAATLAYILSDELTSADITDFTIVGSNLRCNINKNYHLRNDTFNPSPTGNSGNWHTTFGNTRTLTHFLDLQGRITGIADQNFVFQENCSFVFLPNVSTVGTSQVFRGTNGSYIYLNGSYSVIGTSVSTNSGTFNQFSANPNRVYVNNSMATINGGTPEADITNYLSTQANSNVYYVDIGEVPLAVQNQINSIIS